MLKKIVSVLLFLSLSLSFCMVHAEDMKDEDFVALGDTGIEMWIWPGLKQNEVTEEYISGGYILFFGPVANVNAYGINVRLCTGRNMTQESCAKRLSHNNSLSEVTAVTINDIPCVTYLEDFTVAANKCLLVILENGDYLELCFTLYSEEEFTEMADAMIQSVRKAE
ncbi:MAG: hypothetical protein IKQ45_07930 [Clostridia bacterium]|nr:hypothetical protein [Clostridia bacterium]